ncbi:hypothetical protein AXX16_4068 [Serratia rubidaea]|nr:hypothetical protein AXX16_4068 [Serratia rubidaea]
MPIFQNIEGYQKVNKLVFFHIDFISLADTALRYATKKVLVMTC